MSHTTAARLSHGQSVVAIVSDLGTSAWGSAISSVFLSPNYRPFFSRILVLAHEVSMPAVCGFAGPGAEVFALPHKNGNFAAAVDALKDRLHGVDVLVNPSVGQNPQMDSILIEAASAARVCACLNVVTSDDQAAGPQGSAASPTSRPNEGGNKMQIVSIHAGLCMESVLSTRTEGTIRIPAPRTPYTSALDLGRTLAELSILAMTSPSRVPAIVRVASDIVSGEQIVEIVQGLQDGGQMVEIVEADSFAKDEDGGADNELVNPGERSWKWKNFQDALAEV